MPLTAAEPEARIHVGKIVGPELATPDLVPPTRLSFYPTSSISMFLWAIPGLLAVAFALPAFLNPDEAKSPANPAVQVAATSATFQEAVSWSRVLEVQDTDEAVSVLPLVSFEERGGFLVADVREAQIRRYSAAGKLIASFGRRGHGPGEFVSLSGVLRLSESRLLATDMNGQLTTVSDEGQVLRTDRVPLTPLYGAAKLDDSTVVLMGRSRGDGPKLLLHLWDIRKHVLRLSFFAEPEHSANMNDAYRYTGFPHVAIRGEQIAATFAIDRQVRFFDRTGNLTGSLEIPFRDFRPLTSPIPKTDSPEAFQAWVESFSVLSRLYWLADGSFLILYFDKVGQEPQWRLLRMSSGGELLFEGPSPRLLAARSPGSLLFVAPEADEPNVWQFASVQPSPRR